MVQVSMPQQFCTQCGASISNCADTQRHTCPYCGKEFDARYSHAQGQEYFADSEATLRVAARNGLLLSSDGPYDPAADTGAAWHASMRSHPTDDTDATERASTQFLTRLYARAIQQEALTTAAERTPRKPLPGKHQFPMPVKWMKKYTRKQRLAQLTCAVGVFLLFSLLVLGVVGYTGSAGAQQQIARSKAALDQQISRARLVGVPSSLLQPVLQQEQQLDSSSSLLARLINASAYASLTNRYQALEMRVPDVIAEATDQAHTRAQQDMQNFQTALSRETAQGAGNIQSFEQQFSQQQLALQTAQTPRDYETISQNARDGILSLSAMEVTLGQLNDFNTAIASLKAAHIDVIAMQAEYQNDLQLFSSATQVSSFENLSTLLDAQYQQVVVGSVQAFPYVSVRRLNELQMQILQFKTYGLNASAYQVRLNADQAAVEHARTLTDDLAFLKQVDADIASMHDGLMQGEARYLVAQFHQEVATWAKVYPYFDPYDKHTYALDSGYTQAGIGATLDSDLASATTTADFGVMVDEAQNALFNLHMLEADYNDHTPYNQVHQTDLDMLTHYNLQNRTVLMISTVEQAMRIYQNGILLRSFSVTTGRSELPSLPGVWGVLERKSPIIFQSADPKGSPYWFPNTPIKYAILYHYGGYFVHDAWWRANFGPGTQFPHQDSSGTSSYNFDGSHGCINLSENDAAWVYQHTDWNTQIVIY